MSHNAKTDKPQLTLLKRKIPLSKRVIDEFEFDFEFGDDADLVYPPEIHFHKIKKSSESQSFSELLKEQTKIIQRINYFADELEFNLD